MSAGYTNLRTVSYRDTIAELLDRANQTHTRATGVQVFSPGDGMAYEDTEGFINPISPALFDDAKSQIAEASEALVAAEAELEEAQGRIDETTALLGQLDEQAAASAEQVAGVVKDMAADRLRLDAAAGDLDALKPRLGDVEGAISASDAKASQAVSDAAKALQEAQQAREYAEGLDPSTGDGSYAEAMQVAQQAARDALAAMERANLAVTSASGKSSVRNATSAPQGVGTAVGDTWFQWTAFPGGTVTGQWTWDGAEWRPVTLSHQVLSSVDLGKATVGELEGGRIKAHTMEANRLTIGVGPNAIADPMFSSVDLTNRRMSESVGTWTQNRAGATPFVSSAGTSAVTFRYSGASVSNAIPTVAGQKWRIQAQVNPGGGQVRTKVRWFNAAGASSYVDASAFATGNEGTSISTIWEAPATAVGFLVDVHSPVASDSRTVRVYAGISVQSMTGAVHIEDGAITASKVNAEEVAGALGQFVKVQAENVEVTDTLATRVLSAARAEVAEAFITDRLVLGTGDDRTVLDVLGTAVVNDLNLRGTLRGRDAILTGTVDVAQLNVTGDMAAEIGRYMRLETKKLIVTEAAVMQHVTAIEGIITPKITASEAKMGSLIAEKASIADIEGGNLTLTGHFRSGAVGKPGVIIPKNYTTQAGMQQLGVWLAPDGKAPSLGSEMGMTAGMWLDNASNTSGSTNKSQLHIRGQGGRGIQVWGDLQIVPASNSRANIHSNTDLGIISTRGDLWGQGTALHYVARDGDMVFKSFGKGKSVFEALGSGDMDIGSTTNANINASQDLNLRGFQDVALKVGRALKLVQPNGDPYFKTWSGSGLHDLKLSSISGTVFTDTSTRRAKTDIRTMEPDHEWLDMRTVWYKDKNAVKVAEDVESRRSAGNCAPLSAEEHELIESAGRYTPGRIAEEGAEIGSPQVVYGSDGQVESWDYSRDAVMLTPHVREHRDKIADLESRLAELESALL